MKTKHLLLLSFVISHLSFSSIAAQPWVKKAAKSVFTLKTFDAGGALLGSGNGVFVGEQGEAVSNFAPFHGAWSAVVIDAAGKEYPVEVLLGANDTYDVAKFRVAVKKSQPLAMGREQPSGCCPTARRRRPAAACCGRLRRSEVATTTTR